MRESPESHALASSPRQRSYHLEALPKEPRMSHWPITWWRELNRVSTVPRMLFRHSPQGPVFGQMKRVLHVGSSHESLVQSQCLLGCSGWCIDPEMATGDALRTRLTGVDRAIHDRETFRLLDDQRARSSTVQVDAIPSP
jgi:hypothetical protein